MCREEVIGFDERLRESCDAYRAEGSCARECEPIGYCESCYEAARASKRGRCAGKNPEGSGGGLDVMREGQCSRFVAPGPSSAPMRKEPMNGAGGGGGRW